MVRTFLFRPLSLAMVLALALGFLAIGPRSAAAAELIMVERDGCPWCKRWNEEIGLHYADTDEGKRAPLRRHNLASGQPKLMLKGPILYTPTFLLAEDGREFGRITGYADNAMFWGLLGSMLKQLEEGATR